jgi:hypothetical protein
MVKSPNIGRAQNNVIVALLCLAVGIGVFDGRSLRQPPAKINTADNAHGGAVQSPEKSPNITDWLLVLFNGLLVVSTALLWRANNRSAAIAERALSDLERPWVLITDASITGIFADPPFIEIEKGNFGRAAGTVVGIRAGFKIYSFEIDPASIKMTEHSLDEVGNALVPDKLYTSKISFKPYREPQARTGIEAGAYNFVLRAVLQYQGLTDATYETGFCFRYEAERNRFIRYGGKNYNYTK